MLARSKLDQYLGDVLAHIQTEKSQGIKRYIGDNDVFAVGLPSKDRGLGLLLAFNALEKLAD